jgi:hypothetical protein
MSEQNQGTCLSKYMKNCEKKKIFKNIIDNLLYDKNGVFFTKKTTTLLRSIGINMYTNETGLRLGSR